MVIMIPHLAVDRGNVNSQIVNKLGVSKICDVTVENYSIVVLNTLNKWNIKFYIKAMFFKPVYTGTVCFFIFYKQTKIN